MTHDHQLHTKFNKKIVRWSWVHPLLLMDWAGLAVSSDTRDVKSFLTHVSITNNKQFQGIIETCGRKIIVTSRLSTANARHSRDFISSSWTFSTGFSWSSGVQEEDYVSWIMPGFFHFFSSITRPWVQIFNLQLSCRSTDRNSLTGDGWRLAVLRFETTANEMEEEIVCNRWKDLAGDQMCCPAVTIPVVIFIQQLQHKEE